MSFQKCPACDGYGNRPHRSKPGKLVRCRACKGAAVLGFADIATPAQVPCLPVHPVPFIPYPGGPNINPARPFIGAGDIIITSITTPVQRSVNQPQQAIWSSWGHEFFDSRS